MAEMKIFDLRSGMESCYTVSGKRENTQSTRSTPKLAPWGVLLFPYGRQGSEPRLVAVVSLIEPFADAVGNHTSQDGENKRQNTHQAHPPSLAKCRGGNEQSIAYSSPKGKNRWHQQTLYNKALLMNPVFCSIIKETVQAAAHLCAPYLHKCPAKGKHHG